VGIPGVQVVQATVPAQTDAQGTTSLSGLVVDTGDPDRPQQSATSPLLIQIGQTARQIVLQFLRPGNSSSSAQQTVNVGPPFTVGYPPTWPPSQVQRIKTTPSSTGTSTSSTVATPAQPQTWPPSQVQHINTNPGSASTSTSSTATGTTDSKIWNPSRVQWVDAPPASAYTTPPVYSSGALQVIHGPVSGNSMYTNVLVDGKPGSIIAENPRALFFKLPANTAPGAHSIAVTEGGRILTSFHVAVISLKLSADLLTLKQGQSTNIHATILGADSIPESAWHAGIEKDLVNPETLVDSVPASAMTPEKPGVIALSVENRSQDTAVLSGSKGNRITQLLGRESFAQGPYTFTGKITSVRDGAFNINVHVAPILAPIQGEAAAQQ
jgi:hypothetical protein